MFNRNLKRVLFFTASCSRPGAESDNEMAYSDEEMFIDDGMMDGDQEQMDFAMEDM